MRQDRKVNKLIFVSSILEILFGVISLATGIFVGVFGFTQTEQINKLKDVQFFINQNWFVKLQLKLFNNQTLKMEFLYVALGTIIAVLGLIILVTALIQIGYVKKRKVTRRKVLTLIFTLIPAALVTACALYLYFDFNILTDNIKYALYGIISILGLACLFSLLGLIVNRSEKFMSNDNSKYSFDNSSLRGARVNVNNNIKNAPQLQQQPNIRPNQLPPQNARPREQGAAPTMPNRPVQRPMQGPAQGMQRPNPNMHAGIQTRSTGMPRPQINNRAQSTARPVSSNSSMMRPSAPVRQPVRPTAQIRCGKCGKIARDGEVFCSLCGNKINK